METKICSKCKIEKPVSEFNRWNTYKGGYYPSCKKCKAIIREKHRKLHPEQRKEAYKRHYAKYRVGIIKRCSEYIKKHPEVRKKSLLNFKCKNYGISIDEFNKLFNNQQEKCAICKEKPYNHNLFIDHCHRTNKIRGLLCRECNAILGFCNDDVSILQTAINYLNNNGGANCSHQI